jgi:hypothetical protein
MKLTLILALGGPLLIGACDTTGLTPLDGAPAVTVRVDGAVFASSETDTNAQAGYDPTTRYLSFQASTAGQALFKQVGFSLTPFRGIGRYNLQISDSLIAIAYYLPDSRGIPNPSAYNGFGGPNDYVLVTGFDPRRRVIEGRFAFNAVDPTTDSVIHLRSGRFRGRLLPPFSPPEPTAPSAVE